MRIRLLFFTMLLAFCLNPSKANADWVHARCDIYPVGEDHTSVVLPCVFSQRQGFITITTEAKQTYDLQPQTDNPGHYKDERGRDVYRQSGLGEDGLIFRLPDVSIYVYWDTAGLPGKAVDNFTAPYTTARFDATARLDCQLKAFPKAQDCPAGVNRGPKYGQATVFILQPDETEREIHFDGDRIDIKNADSIRIERISDDWIIHIGDAETYRIPQAFIEGG